jgi:putative endonuclease
MYFVYILQSLKDLRTYVGFTDNFERRFKQHNSGKVKSTKHRIPFKLLFHERFSAYSEAKRREAWWKSGAGRRKLKEYFDNLPQALKNCRLFP